MVTFIVSAFMEGAWVNRLLGENRQAVAPLAETSNSATVDPDDCDGTESCFY